MKQYIYIQFYNISKLLPCSRKGTLDALKQHEKVFPLVGRENEVETFMSELHYIKNNPEHGTQRQVVVIKGEAGVGKSRVLDTLVLKAMTENIK